MSRYIGLHHEVKQKALLKTISLLISSINYIRDRDIDHSIFVVIFVSYNKRDRQIKER